jgi:hypothetical protein
VLERDFWKSALAIQDTNNSAASGRGVLAKMAPVCARDTYWSLGVLVVYHDSELALPAAKVRTRGKVRTCGELAESWEFAISNREVAVPFTRLTSFTTRSCS